MLAALVFFLPSESRAQLYVNYDDTVNFGRIGIFNSSTGNTQTADLFATPNPAYFAIDQNTIYVPTNQGAIQTYSASTGALLNANFITGLQGPEGVTVSNGILYVSNIISGTIGEYNSVSGNPINSSFVTGLDRPVGLSVGLGFLYVVNQDDQVIGKYDATTGATINADFIQETHSPITVLEYGGFLYVSDFFTVAKYDAVSGALLNANFITGLEATDSVVTDGTYLYVADSSRNSVGKYDLATGNVVDANFISGINDPSGMVLVPEPGAAWQLAFAALALACWRPRRLVHRN